MIRFMGSVKCGIKICGNLWLGLINRTNLLRLFFCHGSLGGGAAPNPVLACGMLLVRKGTLRLAIAIRVMLGDAWFEFKIKCPGVNINAFNLITVNN